MDRTRHHDISHSGQSTNTGGVRALVDTFEGSGGANGASSRTATVRSVRPVAGEVGRNVGCRRSQVEDSALVRVRRDEERGVPTAASSTAITSGEVSFVAHMFPVRVRLLESPTVLCR